MTITVNNDAKDVAEGITVLELLESLDVEPKVTVVLKNGDIVERRHFSDTRLAEGDKLDLVHFVGGG
jgi:thiamine biosynthesis protein ThiS